MSSDRDARIAARGQPIPLYRGPLAEASDEACAISDELERAVARIVTPLLDAGYDAHHVESLLVRNVAWAVTMWKLRSEGAK